MENPRNLVMKTSSSLTTPLLRSKRNARRMKSLMRGCLNYGKFGWGFGDTKKHPSIGLTVAEKDRRLNDLVCLATPNSGILREQELKWWDRKLGRKVARHPPQIFYCKKHDKHHSSIYCVLCEESRITRARQLGKEPREISCA